MPREQTQDQNQNNRGNPGTFSPDDDEAQENDLTTASDMPQQGDQRLAQNDAAADVSAEELEDEESEESEEDEEDDEDEDEDDVDSDEISPAS